MQVHIKVIIVALASFALAIAAIASTNKATSETKCSHFAPLRKARGPDILYGGYMIVLRNGYDMTQHFEHIGQSLEHDPPTNWNARWLRSAGSYYVTHLKSDSLGHIRCDPGVESSSESKMWTMDPNW